MDIIIDLKEWLRSSMTDNIWISIKIWLLDLLSIIITAHYQFFKSLFPPFFDWYLWQPNIRPCTWSSKVWHVYDRAGTWSSRGQNSRSTYSVSPLCQRHSLSRFKMINIYLHFLLAEFLTFQKRTSQFLLLRLWAQYHHNICWISLYTWSIYFRQECKCNLLVK